MCIMNSRLASLVMTLTACAAPLLAQTIEVGVPESRVRELLGRPTGRLESGPLTMLSYDRGIVTLVDGRVTTNSLVSAEEARRRAEWNARIQEEKREAEEAARQRRIAVGTAELQQTLTDAAFTNRPAVDRLAYWEKFRRTYPEVTVLDQLAAVQKELAVQQATEREALNERIKTTEARINEVANRSGLGRAAFIAGARELTQLRQELADLREQQSDQERK